MALGDWVESDHVYFEASPEVISSSGWVEFTLLSKQFSGDCDLAWGFDSNEIQPRTPEFWANFSHSLWEWGSELDENGTAYPVKEYYTEWFYDWKPLGISPTKLSFQHRGMDRWYLFKEVPITAGKVYKIRCWMNVEFPGLGKISGNYFFGMKRSIDTVQEAISTGRFFLLDPWYDSTWSHRLKITFDNSASSENLTDFPVMVKLDSSNFDFSLAQESGNDLFPTDSDGNISLAYEVEEYNYSTETAVIWIKVPQIDNGSTTDHIWLYYGNEEASSSEDLEAVWNTDYAMVQHMVDETNSTILDSTQYDNDGAKRAANEPIEIAGYIAMAQAFDGANDYIQVTQNANINNLENFTVSFIINGEEFANNPVVYGKSANKYVQLLLATNIQVMIKSSGGNFISKSSTGLSYGPWHSVAIIYNNATDRKTHIYVNGTELGYAQQDAVTGVLNADAASDILLGVYPGGGYAVNATLDEVRISKVSRSPDWIEASYLSMTDQFISYGEPELCDYTLTLQILGSDPIEGATLSLSGEGGEYYDVSDSEGWVQLVVPWGSYEITISSTGYYVNPVTFTVDGDLYGPAGLLGVEEGVMIANEFNVASLAVLSLAIIFTVIYFMSDKKWQGGIVAVGAWAISAMVTMGENIDAWPQATFFAGMAMLLTILLSIDHAGARKVDFWE